jgi:hypothetical protein
MPAPVILRPSQPALARAQNGCSISRRTRAASLSGTATSPEAHDLAAGDVMQQPYMMGEADRQCALGKAALARASLPQTV